MLLLGMARLSSKRCPRKMVRKFECGLSLFDLYLDKLVALAPHFDEVVMALHWDDVELVGAVGDCLPIIYRDERSVKGENGKDIFNFLSEFDQEKVLWVNGCQPLLCAGTLLNIINSDVSVSSEEPIMLDCGWHWRRDNTSVNANCCVISTKETPYLWESSHSYHMFDRKRMLDKGTYWGDADSSCDPYRRVMDPSECLDVDTDFDWFVADCVVSRLHEEGRLEELCALS